MNNIDGWATRLSAPVVAALAIGVFLVSPADAAAGPSDTPGEPAAASMVFPQDNPGFFLEGPQAPGEQEGYTESRWELSHVPGARLDVGFGDIAALGLGVGYMYAVNWRIQVMETELLFRGGAGPDVNLVGGTGRGFEGTNLYGTLRLTATGPRGGITLKSGFGWGVERGEFFPGMRFGVFFARETFEIGYFYQAALQARPQLMTPHNFGVRVYAPDLEF